MINIELYKNINEFLNMYEEELLEEEIIKEEITLQDESCFFWFDELNYYINVDAINEFYEEKGQRHYGF